MQAVLFRNVALYRESIKMINKFQLNFGSRTLQGTKIDGLLDLYLQTIFQYSVQSMQYQGSSALRLSILQDFMSLMNTVWYRQSLESGSKNEAQQQRAESFTKAII